MVAVLFLDVFFFSTEDLWSWCFFLSSVTSCRNGSCKFMGMRFGPILGLQNPVAFCSFSHVLMTYFWDDPTRCHNHSLVESRLIFEWLWDLWCKSLWKALTVPKRVVRMQNWFVVIDFGFPLLNWRAVLYKGCTGGSRFVRICRIWIALFEIIASSSPISTMLICPPDPKFGLFERILLGVSKRHLYPFRVRMDGFKPRFNFPGGECLVIRQGNNTSLYHTSRREGLRNAPLPRREINART